MKRTGFCSASQGGKFVRKTDENVPYPTQSDKPFLAIPLIRKESNPLKNSYKSGSSEIVLLWPVPLKKSQPLRVRRKAVDGAKNNMFPRGAFVKMYYFAIEAREGIGYTLAALRCERKRSVKI
jgi:hypothetical protein